MFLYWPTRGMKLYLRLRFGPLYTGLVLEFGSEYGVGTNPFFGKFVRDLEPSSLGS